MMSTRMLNYTIRCDKGGLILIDPGHWKFICITAGTNANVV